MAIKQTLTLCLFSFLALILTINGANVAAPPPVDCTNAFMDMAGCLPFVEKGSKIATPNRDCCPGFKQVVETNVECLCEVFKQSGSMGVTLDYTRALSLPSVCNVKTPPFSQCNITLPGVSPPAKSPPALSPAKSPPTVSPPTVSPPAKSPPTVSPPTVSPPAKSPPTVSSPTVSPPAKSPPTVSSPTVSPPAKSPPTVSSPTVSPPAKSPPTVAPPAKSPPTVSPPAKSPVTLPGVSPSKSPATHVVSPHVTSPVASSPSNGHISPSPTGEASSSSDSAPPAKSIAAQIKIHPFTTILVAFTILICRNSI